MRERLSHVRRTIAAEQSSLRAVATQASEGLTLHRGLKDAGHVLLVALVALLIAGAVLVPLASRAQSAVGAPLRCGP